MYLSTYVKRYANDSYTKMRVLELHYDAHHPCSAIDEILALPKGTAHDIMVEWWAYDKMCHSK